MHAREHPKKRKRSTQGLASCGPVHPVRTAEYLLNIVTMDTICDFFLRTNTE